MGRLRLAVIGVGHLGKEHARILSALPDVALVGVADVNAAQAEEVAQRCHTRAFKDYRPLLDQVDAAVIVVPTSHHHVIAGEFLRRGIPLLVEKPLALNLAEADELVALARKHGTLLQVGHIERFNPAYEELQQHAFKPRLIVCERLGPFSGRSTDIGAVLDLMIHDLDALLALVGAPIRSVDAVGVSVLGGQEDVASAHLLFMNGCVADLTASRVHRTPSRRMRLWSTDGFAELDYARRHLTVVRASEELREQKHALDRRQPSALVSLKEELFGRYLEVEEIDRKGGDQLTSELIDFVHCVRSDARPRVSGEDGRDAIALATRVLERIHGPSWQRRYERLPGDVAA